MPRETAATPALPSRPEHQHQRAQQDHTGKAEDHDLKGRQMVFQMETGFCHGTHLLKSTAFPIARTV